MHAKYGGGQKFSFPNLLESFRESFSTRLNFSEVVFWKCLQKRRVCDFIKYITCFLFNSLAKPYLEALESMLEEEEEHEDGEEEDHEEEEEGEEGGEEEEEEDPYRKFIENELSDDSVE